MRLWEQSEGLWLNHESVASVLPPPSSGYSFLHESLVGRWASKMNWDCRTGLWACADLNVVGNVMLELLRRYTARLVERNLCWWFHLCTALFIDLFLTGRCSTLKYDFFFFFFSPHRSSYSGKKKIIYFWMLINAKADLWILGTNGIKESIFNKNFTRFFPKFS